MAVYINPEESVEGKYVLAHGRKIVPVGIPVFDKVAKVFRYYISIKLGGGGIVQKCHDPLRHKFRAESRLALGDEIKGNILDGWSHKLFKPNDVLVGGSRSGSHPGQSWRMEGDCFLQVVTNWQKQAEVETVPSRRLKV